jgi:hypothetical protein
MMADAGRKQPVRFEQERQEERMNVYQAQITPDEEARQMRSEECRDLTDILDRAE